MTRITPMNWSSLAPTEVDRRSLSVSGRPTSPKEPQSWKLQSGSILQILNWLAAFVTRLTRLPLESHDRVSSVRYEFDVETYQVRPVPRLQ